MESLLDAAQIDWGYYSTYQCIICTTLMLLFLNASIISCIIYPTLHNDAVLFTFVEG